MYGVCIHCENTLTKDNLCASRIARKSPVCDECRRKQDTNGRMLARIDVFGHYGGKCACCGETEVMFLTIDHTEKRAGKIEREKNPNMVGLTLMKWLRKNGYPEGYRVLCWNCNLCSGLRGYCPHDGQPTIARVVSTEGKYCNRCGIALALGDNWRESVAASRNKICNECCLIRQRTRRDSQKLELLEAYGGPFCVCCGESHIEFLTLDHKLGDGSQERDKLKKVGYTFYQYLAKNEFPNKERYRVLCMNCNCCIGAYGFCPHPQMREVSNG